MATIVITIPDERMSRVVDALAARGRWRSVDLDGNRGVFAKGVVLDYVRTIVRDHEGLTAGNAARSAAETLATTEVTVT